MKRITIIIAFLVCSIYCDTNKDREFINILNPIPCVRRFNATHQIGCSNRDIGDYEGVVYAVRNQVELDRLFRLNSLKSKKLVVVTLPQFFVNVVEFYLNNTENTAINGIVLVVTQNQTFPNQYSDDSEKPNFNFGLYSRNSQSVSWNLGGSSFMFQNFKIPLYVILDEVEAQIPFRDCYEKFNRKIFERADSSNKFELHSTDLLCGMQLGLEMSGSISSTVCIRRAVVQHTLDNNYFCDPLGVANSFTFLSQKPSNSLPITIISSRIDTFTLYEYFTPAANEPISSIIGLLSLAELLSKHRTEMTKNNILFVLFDNEAFDFGGSSRFVNDLINNKFPSININNSNKIDGTDTFMLRRENITKMIELGQLGSVSLSDSNNLYVHRDMPSFNNLNQDVKNQVEDLIQNLDKFSNSSIRVVNQSAQDLPPSSLHSFLRLNLTQLGGIFITDHEIAYKNKYYHSIFDTPESLNIKFPVNITEADAAMFTTNFSKRLQSLITSIAKSVYISSTDQQKPLNDEASLLTLNRLAYCFYKNATCQFFKEILTEKQWKSYLSYLDSVQPKNKLSFYTSVNTAKISGKYITEMLLRYFTRNSLFESLNSTDCSKSSESAQKIIRDNNLTIGAFHFVNNSLCVATSLYSIPSVSPAFDRAEEGVLLNTDRFSAWTESSWNGKSVQMRLFIFTSDAISITTILVGVFTFILSFLITFFVNKYSNKWFGLKNSDQTAEIIEQ